MKEFHVGYSPERINPGDKEHTLTRIVKVVSGDDAATLDAVANLYSSVIKAGVHRASSIAVAEAAKVIENTQRDLNIALMNDNMGKFIAEQTVKKMIASGSSIKGAKVNVLGLTFKENVPDLRNSRVIDVITELRSYGIEVFVHDPVPLKEEAHHEYGIELVSWDDLPVAAAMVHAVAHSDFLKMGPDRLAKKVKAKGCFIDVKSAFDSTTLSATGLSVWRL